MSLQGSNEVLIELLVGQENFWIQKLEALNPFGLNQEFIKTRSTTAVDTQNFKSQRSKYQSNQKLLHHYQQHILVSHKLKGHDYFLPPPFFTKSLNQRLAFLNLYQHGMLKISLFHLFIFEIESLLESSDLIGHTHF